MSNNWFQFKQFKVFQDKSAMKVGVDSVLLACSASFNEPETVLDVGTGTGLLAFMAEQRTNANIIAVEIEENAFEQCKENITFNKKQNRIKVYHKSFQDYYESTEIKFDHIICNPPFFNNSFTSPDDKRNIARHDIRLKPEELFSGVSNIISEKGIFSIIIPVNIFEIYMQLSVHYKLLCFNVIKIFPKKGKDEHRYILEFSKEKRKHLTGNISIRDSDSNQYTEQYKEITKDFYLNRFE